MKQEIKCIYGDTVVGSIELIEGEVYKGDAYYNMVCENHSLEESTKEPKIDLISILKSATQEELDFIKSILK